MFSFVANLFKGKPWAKPPTLLPTTVLPTTALPTTAIPPPTLHLPAPAPPLDQAPPGSPVFPSKTLSNVEDGQFKTLKSGIVLGPLPDLSSLLSNNKAQDSLGDFIGCQSSKSIPDRVKDLEVKHFYRDREEFGKVSRWVHYIYFCIINLKKLCRALVLIFSYGSRVPPPSFQVIIVSFQ